MKKRKTGQLKRQLRMEGQCLGGRLTAFQFPDRPAAVPSDEWESYQQLVFELERAECLVDDVRHRLVSVKKAMRRRIQDRHRGSTAESLERLMAAIPVTDLLQ